MDSKPYISPTQLNMASMCGEAYRRRYIEGERIPPGIAAARGKGFHGGAEVNMRQKVETHADLAVSDIVDAAVAAYDEGVQEGYLLTDEEQSRGVETVLGESRDVVAKLAVVHAERQAPEYQPVLVEEKVRIELPGTHDLLGVIDLVDDKKRVVDFKTTGKSKSQSEADTSLQLTTYSAAYNSRYGTPPDALQLDVLVDLKRETKRQVIETTRSNRDIDALANRIVALQETLNAGVFLPAPPGAWNCSARWCGYWKTCRFVNSERKEKSRED